MIESRALRTQRAILNTLARLFGGLSVFGGACSVLAAFFVSEDRVLYFVLGAMAIAWGIAFLRVKLLSAEDVQRRK
jgi:hypothetical protein